MLPETYFWLPGSRLVIVSSHAAAVAVAVGVGVWWAGRLGGPATRVVGLAAAVGGLVGAHAAFVIERGGSLASLWAGGLSSMGGVAAGIAAAWCAARLVGDEPRRALDAVLPAGLLGLGIGRIGCFLGGCCYGRAADVPWAIVFPDAGADARHPLQLYSAAADLLLVVLVMRIGGEPGRRAWWTLGAFALTRFALETLRDPATTTPAIGVVTVPQIVCAGLLAITALAALRHRRVPEID